jgi:hypothetical protein
VTNLNQVIEFGSAAYPGLSQGTSINAGTGAYLDMVFNYDIPDRIDPHDLVIKACNLGFLIRSDRFYAPAFRRDE